MMYQESNERYKNVGKFIIWHYYKILNQLKNKNNHVTKYRILKSYAVTRKRSKQ